MSKQLDIKADAADYWLKILGMLQEEWAILQEESGLIHAYIVRDGFGPSWVLERLCFGSYSEAGFFLSANGFVRYKELAPDLEGSIDPPLPPYFEKTSTNGKYGRFLKFVTHNHVAK